MPVKSASASEILICCGQTASQLRQPMQALGCLSAGSADKRHRREEAAAGEAVLVVERQQVGDVKLLRTVTRCSSGRRCRAARFGSVIASASSEQRPHLRRAERLVGLKGAYVLAKLLEVRHPRKRDRHARDRSAKSGRPSPGPFPRDAACAAPPPIRPPAPPAYRRAAAPSPRRGCRSSPRRSTFASAFWKVQSM